jgi:RNA exonuclease NGL2
LSMSRVVHISVETDAALQLLVKVTEESEDSPTTDPDKVITNARPARPQDGLLSTDELIALYPGGGKLRSIYEEAQRDYRAIDASHQILGDRLEFPPHRKGAYEPMWTSYTHYWKTVLGGNLWCV